MAICEAAAAWAAKAAARPGKEPNAAAMAEAARDACDALGDELASLKAEVEELTVSHDLEVERLQERLSQLEREELQVVVRRRRVLFRNNTVPS